MPPKKAEEPPLEQITIRTVRREGLVVEVIGLKGLLSGRMSDLAQRQLAKEKLTAAEKERLLDPAYVFEQSVHRDEQGRYCLPAMALYRSILAVNEIDGKKENQLTRYITLGCDSDALLPLQLGADSFRQIAAEDRRPEQRQDVIRNWQARGVKAVAVRALFRCPWSVQVPFIYDAEKLTPEKVIALIEHAGFAIGIGCWRPACKGLFGQYTTGLTRHFNLPHGEMMWEAIQNA